MPYVAPYPKEHSLRQTLVAIIAFALLARQSLLKSKFKLELSDYETRRGSLVGNRPSPC